MFYLILMQQSTISTTLFQKKLLSWTNISQLLAWWLFVSFNEPGGNLNLPEWNLVKYEVYISSIRQMFIRLLCSSQLRNMRTFDSLRTKRFSSAGKYLKSDVKLTLKKMSLPPEVWPPWRENKTFITTVMNISHLQSRCFSSDICMTCVTFDLWPQWGCSWSPVLVSLFQFIIFLINLRRKCL